MSSPVISSSTSDSVAPSSYLIANAMAAVAGEAQAAAATTPEGLDAEQVQPAAVDESAAGGVHRAGGEDADRECSDHTAHPMHADDVE